ncbi:MAG: acyltransferase [Desulfocapsa sp.]|nr:acyltransferase [Desulfocapsa sp.]
MKKTHAAVTGHGSPLSKYQEVVVGSRSFFTFLYFEWCMLLGIIPGAAGFVLRKIFWSRLFGSCGGGVNFGAHITVRHPGKIHLRNNVVISEGCILDGRGEEGSESILLGDSVILSNNVTLSCKNGSIRIGANTGINTGAIVQSTNQCPVVIGDDVIIGQMSLVVGGGNYNTERLDILIREQGIKEDGGVRIGDNVWIAANVTVLGGVTVEKGSIIAAGSVMTKSVPAYSVCRGVPATVVKNRQDTNEEKSR